MALTSSQHNSARNESSALAAAVLPDHQAVPVAGLVPAVFVDKCDSGRTEYGSQSFLQRVEEDHIRVVAGTI